MQAESWHSFVLHLQQQHKYAHPHFAALCLHIHILHLKGETKIIQYNSVIRIKKCARLYAAMVDKCKDFNGCLCSNLSVLVSQGWFTMKFITIIVLSLQLLMFHRIFCKLSI